MDQGLENQKDFCKCFAGNNISKREIILDFIHQKSCKTLPLLHLIITYKDIQWLECPHQLSVLLIQPTPICNICIPDNIRILLQQVMGIVQVYVNSIILILFVYVQLYFTWIHLSGLSFKELWL